MEKRPANIPINGIAIRIARQRAGLNVRNLAEIAGLSSPYLSQLERGDRRCASPRVFAQICRGLGIDGEERDRLTLWHEAEAHHD